MPQPFAALLRWSARVFGDDIADRVFAPLIADWAREHALAARPPAQWSSVLRGTAAFASTALDVAVGLSVAGPRDGAAIRRAGASYAVFGLLGIGLLLAPFVPGLGTRGGAHVIPYLAPSMLAFSLPLALVPAAMSLAAATTQATRWRHRGLLVGAVVLSTFALLALLGWIVPAANQTWREAQSPGRRSIMDSREMSLLTLRAAAVTSLVAQRDTVAGADAHREFHRRTAIALAWPAALACLGWRLGRHRPAVSRAGLSFWWVFPLVIGFSLQPTGGGGASGGIAGLLRTPEASAAALWCVMAAAFRPRPSTTEAGR